MKKRLNLKKLLKLLDLKFDDKGLIPAVVQDYKDNKVLMVAYMNLESLKLTLKTKKMCYFSRKRNKLWFKGETSGNEQKVKSVYVDCDNDCLLFKIQQIGRASCHTGYRSCFYRKLLLDKTKFSVVEPKIF